MLVAWLQRKGIRFAASANGGKRHLLEAIKFKRMGVAAGFPDITIPYASGAYHGLYIEMKRQVGGKLSDYQIEWLDFLRSQGYYAECAKGFKEAKDVVEYYFSLTPLAA